MVYIADMTTMIAEVYDALIDAGASEDKARQAASVLADYDQRLAAIERRLAILQLEVGAMLVAFAPGIWLLLRIATKVGALG